MIDGKNKVVVAALALGVSQACAAAKPAIVLVHGAFETADVTFKPVFGGDLRFATAI